MASLSGVVRLVKLDHGFITPHAPLPQGYNCDKNSVFFHNDNVHGGPLMKGSFVEFELNPKSLDRPSARMVWLAGSEKPHRKTTGRQNIMINSNIPREQNETIIVESANSRQMEQQDVSINDFEATKTLENFKANDSETIVKYKGKVDHISGDNIFLLSETKLPEGYMGLRVYLHSSKILLGELPLKVNDYVEFTLEQKDKQRPRAWNANRIECTNRDDEEVRLFLRAVLTKLSSADEKVVLALLDTYATWNAICNSIYLRLDKTTWELIEILNKIAEYRASLKQHVENFFNFLFQTNFFDVENGAFCIYLKNFDISKNITQTRDIEKFLLLLLDLVCEKAKIILKFVKCLVRGDGQMERFLLIVLEKTINANTLTEKCINDVEWDEMPLVPSHKDLLDSSHNISQRLLPVRVKGAYESAYDYMNTYFRLLWADGFESLQKGIQNLLSGQLDHRDMHVYHSVSLISLCLPQFEDDIMLEIKVVHQNDLINWEMTSALMFGNLLCLSPSGNFKDPIYATVANRDLVELKKKGLVKIYLLSECNRESPADIVTSLLANSGHIIMVESPTYYRAYQPIFKALQSMNLDELPFQEELVLCQNPPIPYSPFAKKYCADDGGDIKSQNFVEAVYNFISLCNVSPDQYQFEAIKHALFHRIACIQGPPGTGKTFVGVLIARILLAEGLRQHQRSPILVLTYKNHALDEFLKHLRLHNIKVARVGGRCKDSELENCNLSELKRSKVDRDLWSRLQDLSEQANLLKHHIASVSEILRTRCVFSIESFVQYTSDEVHRKLLLVYLLGKIQRKQKLNNEEKALLQLLSEQTLPNQEFDFIHTNSFATAFLNWLPNVEIALAIEQSFGGYFTVDKNKDLVMNENMSGKTEKNEDNNEDSDEEDEAEMERQLADEKAIKSSKTGKNISFDWKKHEFHLHRLLASAKQLIAEKPISLYLSANPWSLTQIERMVLIQWILLEQTEPHRQQMNILLTEYQRICNERRELEAQHSVRILRDVEVIGMTITGASLYHELIAGLRCPITIVEEAAEILEPQLVAAFGPWIKHLILIGDHQQLRPSVENYHLVKNYHFDISLMERLIRNGLPYTILNLQNRMRPEFANLLLDVYPSIESNLPRVENHLPPQCITKSMFFWNHNNFETKARSVTNEREAEMVVKLALFLLCNGYKPSQITILSAYQGQTKLIRKLIRQEETKHPELFPDIVMNEMAKLAKRVVPSEKISNIQKMRLQAQTIDMYQGDENEIIIVSLVRCNPEQSIGFLNVLNRRCVAQSRAKCGMYLIGSVDTLSGNSNWDRLISRMTQQECVGSVITLCCPYHTTTVIAANRTDDIPLKPFCTEPCRTLMKCGKHQCKLLCQPYHTHDRCSEKEWVLLPRCNHMAKKMCWQDLDQVICYEPCLEKLPSCQHACKKTCNPLHSHSYCTEIVEFMFTMCNHVGNKKCSQSESELKCETMVDFLFAKCGHDVKKKCYVDVQTIKCKSPCNKTSSCGHICTKKCWQTCITTENCEQCEEIRRIERERKRKEEEEIRKIRIENVKKEIKEYKQRPINKTVVKCELSSTGDKAHIFNRLKDMVTKYVQAEHEWVPEVTMIEEVTNTELELKWIESKLSMFEPSYNELKFHGTDASAIDLIIEQGFRLPKKPGMFGKGVYFATDSSKSAQAIYTKGSNKLLVCDVLLGKPLKLDTSKSSMSAYQLNREKCDSVYAPRDTRQSGGVKYDEYVIYNPSRALPKYIIHYKSSLNNVLTPSDTNTSVATSAVIVAAVATNDHKILAEDPVKEYNLIMPLE